MHPITPIVQMAVYDPEKYEACCQEPCQKPNKYSAYMDALPAITEEEESERASSTSPGSSGSSRFASSFSYSPTDAYASGGSTMAHSETSTDGDSTDEFWDRLWENVNSVDT